MVKIIEDMWVMFFSFLTFTSNVAQDKIPKKADMNEPKFKWLYSPVVQSP